MQVAGSYKENPMNSKNLEGSQHYFELKGRSAESFLKSIAEDTFFTDWCYSRPTLPNGKELCDLLVVFDEYLLIWQIKDLKIHPDGKYRAQEVGKNLRQAQGARRKLLELGASITLQNPRRGQEQFQADPNSRVFLFSALLGEGEDYFKLAEEAKEGFIHTVTRSSAEIFLSELDTVKDFIRYYEAKEQLLRHKEVQLVIEGGEENLLAYYLMGKRSFSSLPKEGFILVQDGHWEKFRESSAYAARARENEVSYGWDAIIEIVHTGGSGYEQVARELAKPARLERRGLAQAFMDASLKADIDELHNVFRRVVIGQKTTYCFLFVDQRFTRDARRRMLGDLCFAARGSYQDNAIVIGIATEKSFRPTCSYDFVLLEKPKWDAKDEEILARLRNQTGVLVNPDVTAVTVEEYPTDA
jgi:hypothetical protein